MTLLQPILPFHVAFTLAPTGPQIFAPMRLPIRYQSFRSAIPCAGASCVRTANSPSISKARSLASPRLRCHRLCSICRMATARTYGAITGTLSHPLLDLVYVLVPGRSQVQFPGG